MDFSFSWKDMQVSISTGKVVQESVITREMQDTAAFSICLTHISLVTVSKPQMVIVWSNWDVLALGCKLLQHCGNQVVPHKRSDRITYGEPIPFLGTYSK